MKLILLLLSFPVISSTILPEETNYYYQETVPGHKIILEFEYPACAGKLAFDQRYSIGEVKNGRVRIVNLRGRLDEKCTSAKKSFMKYEIAETNKLMTHAFIIVDKEVRAIRMESR